MSASSTQPMNIENQKQMLKTSEPRDSFFFMSPHRQW